MKPSPRAEEVRQGRLRFLKVNVREAEWRDVYHWMLTLSWPQFAALILGFYTLVNLFFAEIYVLGGACIAELPPGDFSRAFFFSVETLATVGYGHMYPDTLYGHIATTLEIMVGMFGMAVVTGLIFIRFSRPSSRLEYSRSMVVGPFDGKPVMTFRVANLRNQPMAEAEFRLMLIRNETTLEGEVVRRFYPLRLQFDRIILFPAALTMRHVLDETSPLHGMSPQTLEESDARFLVSVVCVDTVLPGPVYSQYHYDRSDVLFGHRFVEIYTELDGERLEVDYGRISETEPIPSALG